MALRNLLAKWLLPAVVAVTMAAVSTAAFAAKGVIKLHEGDWTGNLVDGKLAQIILEDEMDYKVKMIFLPSGPVVFEAIIGGEIDAAFEYWPSYNPTKDVYFTKWGGDGSLEYISEVGVIGQSGWYVPRYVIEGDAERGIAAVAPDLKTFAQLDKYKSLFTVPETAPQGRLLACPVAAWQCMDAERIEGLGLDYKAVVLGSELAHWTEFEAAYARGEPIIAYAWEPHWIHAKLDLVEIGLPEYSDDAWPAADWPEDITFNFGSVTLKERYPDVHQLIGNIRLTNAQQAGMILDVDVNEMDLEAAVRKWMAANEEIWRGWIPAPM
ncbi:MAG: glycine betaine ABC transporter substrate-binding protein [Kiloniellales bacterium]